MNLFKKDTDAEQINDAVKSAKQKKRRFNNLLKKKYGTYAIAITAVVVAAVVALNLLFGILASRVMLDFDLSLAGEKTLTDDNIDFLNTLEVDVKLTVCADKDDYTGGFLEYYTANQAFNATDASGKYYAQTIRFLELYDHYDHISVEFVDPQKPEFSVVMKEYSSANLSYGDIIVSATHMVDGKENVRSTVVAFDDIYYLSDESGYAAMGYGQYTVSGNSFETAVSGAIKKVAATETKKVGVVGTHCTTSVTEYYASILKLNNFEMTSINDTIIQNISNEISVLLIASPKEDFAISELEIIEKWLYNDGERGRGVIFFASTSSPALPNLYNFLEEWGIGVENGVLFDTNSQTHMQNDPMTMLFRPTTDKSDSIDAVVGDSSSYIFGNCVPLTQIYETNVKRKTEVPIRSYSDAVVIAPVGSEMDWKPSSNVIKTDYAGMVITTEEEYVDNILKSSYVVAFASDSVISTELASYSSIGNMDSAVNTMNLVSGVEDSGFSFYMKTIDTESFYDKVTESSANAISIIFQWAIPLILIVWGVIVFVRRSHR